MPRKKSRGEFRLALTLLTPLFVLIAIFIAFPLLYSFYLTFNDFSLRDLKAQFIGLGNYLALLKDPVFRASLTHTAYFTVISMLVGIPLALGVALLLNEEFPGRSVARVCLLIPWALPPIVVAIMFSFMMNTSYGIVNYILKAVGLTTTSIAFFGDPKLALNSLILVNLWKVTPLYAIIFLSALQNIPVETVESAKVYGAGAWQRFRKVTLPCIRPTIIIIAILTALLSLQVFDIIIS
ncbi:MAG: sugar ABC transporter permease, partial [Candidatus Bathyarchaeia archaeon]